MERRWTTHGHWIGEGPEPKNAPDRPKLVARCGGPGLCGQCSREKSQGEMN